MNNAHTRIGFSKQIRLEWLEATSNLLLAGNNETCIVETLAQILGDNLSGGKKSERRSREKVISILMKIWVRPPLELQPLRNDGLKLLSTMLPDKHPVVHWGMAMAVYPFWGAVAAHVGRLLKLQETASAGEVRRRLQEHYGDRETVSRSARSVLRSFVDWGVLRDTAQKGIYAPGATFVVNEVEMVAWLAEAFLRSHPGRSVELGLILDAPSFFPFHLKRLSADHMASTSDRLQVLRHGLDEELLFLRY